MFVGEYQHTLDIKGRITIPAKYRDQLQASFIATKGMDNSIFLYPLDEWRIIEDKLKSLPFTRTDVRSFSRLFFSAATELEMDKQGRTVLPLYLREYADIDKETVIIGVGSRIEIWAAEKWQEYKAETEPSFYNSDSLFD